MGVQGNAPKRKEPGLEDGIPWSKSRSPRRCSQGGRTRSRGWKHLEQEQESREELLSGKNQVRRQEAPGVGAGVQGGRGVPNIVKSHKETTKAVPERQGKEVRTANWDSDPAVQSRELQKTKVGAGASTTKAYKHGTAGAQRETAVAKETA